MKRYPEIESLSMDEALAALTLAHMVSASPIREECRPEIEYRIAALRARLRRRPNLRVLRLRMERRDA